MRKILLILLIILSFSQVKAVFTNFANPDKKKSSKQTIKRKIIKKIAKKKSHKIKTAIVWLLPQREFLGKELSTEEQKLVDSEALTRFIDAAAKKNPEAYKIYRSNNKNTQLIKNFTNLIAQKTNNNLLNNYIESRNQQQELQKAVLMDEIKNINKLYQKLKQNYSKGSKTSKRDYQDLRSKISECCGLENFLYVESLLKREINYEVFNS